MKPNDYSLCRFILDCLARPACMKACITFMTRPPDVSISLFMNFLITQPQRYYCGIFPQHTPPPEKNPFLLNGTVPDAKKPLTLLIPLKSLALDGLFDFWHGHDCNTPKFEKFPPQDTPLALRAPLDITEKHTTGITFIEHLFYSLQSFNIHTA